MKKILLLYIVLPLYSMELPTIKKHTEHKKEDKKSKKSKKTSHHKHYTSDERHEQQMQLLKQSNALTKKSNDLKERELQLLEKEIHLLKNQADALEGIESLQLFSIMAQYQLLAATGKFSRSQHQDQEKFRIMLRDYLKERYGIQPFDWTKTEKSEQRSRSNTDQSSAN